MTTALPPIAIDQLVVNWHVNEACNYRCNYCYAKWTDRRESRDLIRDPEATETLLRALWSFFAPQNRDNPLRSAMDWKRVRLNFAGGEPLLVAGPLSHAVRVAKGLGFNVSIITNGSKLDQETLKDLAPRLDWLGLSVDSPDPEINREIGRIDRRGRLPGKAVKVGSFTLLIRFTRCRPQPLKVSRVRKLSYHFDHCCPPHLALLSQISLGERSVGLQEGEDRSLVFR